MITCIDTAQASEVAERAKRLRDGVNILHVIERGEQRDPLADICAVLGRAPRVFTADVLKRLTALNEDAYGRWTPGDLKRMPEAAGAEPYKSDGRMVVGRDRVVRAVAKRDADGSASTAE